MMNGSHGKSPGLFGKLKFPADSADGADKRRLSAKVRRLCRIRGVFAWTSDFLVFRAKFPARF